MNLTIKRGPFHKKSIPFNSVVNWYVYEDKTYRSLYITWNDESGKLKKIQLIAQLGEPGFTDLIEGLNQSMGAKNLNHLPKKEAFKLMKAADPKKAAAIGMIIAVLILTTVFMFPKLCHFFDFGFEEATVQQLVDGETDTRNLNLIGVPLPETMEEVTTSTKNSSTTTTRKIYVPIVSDDYAYDGPVEVIMQFDDLSDAEYYKIMDEVEFTGVARTIAWEGLEDDEKEFFATEYGLDVSDDVIMFEVTGEEHNDSLMFYVWLLINGLVVIIFGIVYLRSK
jgi:hypothetical protein